jgi:sugar diacid utilization regulator
VAVLALASDSPIAATRKLDFDVLAGADADGAWLVLADPDGPGRGAALERAIEGEPAALGPAVAPVEAHRSLRWARLTLELAESGALPNRGLVRVKDHLGTVILLQDPEMARALAEDRLRALSQLPRVERERLVQTLAAWLAHQRQTPRIAQELHVHPQTVRYRIAKLRELLGEALDTPAGRFELELALRADRALSDPPRTGAG